jgi:hypothetical protein
VCSSLALQLLATPINSPPFHPSLFVPFLSHPSPSSFLNMPGDILKKRKIAVLGSRSVGEFGTLTISDVIPISYVTTTGKSSLVVQFTENQFIDSYYPTIENTFTKSVNYKGVDYDCDIIDTAGQVFLSRSYALRMHTYHTTLARMSIQSLIPSMQLASTALFSSTRSPREILSTWSRSCMTRSSTFVE